MRPPEFWDHVHGRASAPTIRALLAPIAWVYHARRRARMARIRPEKVTAPVLCVGGATLGGAGKTPVLRAIAAHIRARAVPLATMSRGYGGQMKGPIEVDPGRMDAREVGDEALLLAGDGMHVIGADRVLAAKLALAAGARMLALDDGFQNPHLHKDLSLLVVDAATRFGSGRLFPLGPLRERLGDAMARAQAIVLVHARRDAMDDQVPVELAGFRGPVLKAFRETGPVRGPEILAAGARVCGFAGLARPERFFDSLKAEGLEVTDFTPFPDHHPFRARELAILARSAEDLRAALITSEKDWVRLPPEWRARVHVLPMRIEFGSEDQLMDVLAPVLPPVLGPVLGTVPGPVTGGVR